MFTSFRVLAVASGDYECFARDPGRVVGSEENRGAGDVLGLPNPAKRGLRFDLLAHVTFSDAGRMGSFRLHHSGPDGVDANSARAEFRRQRTRDPVHCPFCSAVNCGLRNGKSADYGTDIDDASAAAVELLLRRLRSE